MAISTNLNAQVGKDSVLLEDVQVVGKSMARRMQEQAYAISVLDLKKQYQTAAPLNKLLNSVTSVKIREDGGLGSNYSFSLNGFSGNQVKFFIDGIPMDNFGSSFNLANISANMADRIEVYKGVLPVYLGSDALGGAVNIVSRKMPTTWMPPTPSVLIIRTASLSMELTHHMEDSPSEPTPSPTTLTTTIRYGHLSSTFPPTNKRAMNG